MDDKLPPIAIVGMSWRFPGEARSASGFWDILRKGESAKTRIPAERFDPDAYYHPSADRQGAITTKEGHFLKEDIGLFDAPFFSLTAAEAEGMDPQHRILLEVTYEAFENAGMPLKTVAGSQTAVMVGCFTKDYEVTSGREGTYMSPYASTGCGGAMTANRLSWFYDLRGPSLMIDTACSSSLVGLHLACREIQSGGSKMAVVAGTNLMIQPEVWRGLSALGFLSPDGQCHSFDSRANGYGRGEGVGVIVLKPLMDAVRDHDVIRAVIRGTGINQDGKTSGITVPSSEAQVNLIRSTYAAAGLDFSETAYFEAHGTGTPVGDPLELSAIGETIGISKAVAGSPPLLVGSVKSNIGHLEGASGIAGLIKTVLILEKGQVPAVHGFEAPNPRFQLDKWNIHIPTELTPWPTTGLRRASVNSFGYGGTNSHVILDDAFHYLAEQDGVTRISQTYADHIKHSFDLAHKESEDSLATLDSELSLVHTLAERRTTFDYRGFAVATSLTDLQQVLESTPPKATRSLKTPSCAWVFTGQGAQWPAMGRELQEIGVFQNSLLQADNYIASLGSDFSLVMELNRSGEKSRINEPRFSQVLCTVVQVALVELLRYWQLRPKAVVGHSSGEIAAAYASGALSREAAWRIAYFRGVHSEQIATLLPNTRGSMLAVNISEAGIRSYLDRVTQGEAVVACINSPTSVTVSGDTSAVAQVENLLQSDDVWCRKLKVQTAYHSPHMKVIAEQYLASIQDIQPSELSDASFFSSVLGSELPPSGLGADYWVQNLLSPVRFSEAVTTLLSQSPTKFRRKGMAGVNALIEIGPHSALQGPLRDIVSHISNLNANAITYTSLLQREKNARVTALDAAGKLWSLGFNLDLARVNSSTRSPSLHWKPLVNLPRYPFNHKRRYWHEARSTRLRRTRNCPRTDLPGLPTDDHNNVTPRWTNFISPIEVPWLMDHQIQGLVVFPGAAMLAMVLEACKQTAGPRAVSIQGYEFHDVTFSRAMVFSSSVAVVETVLQLRPHNSGTRSTGTTATHWMHFSIMSIAPDGTAAEHCSGLVRALYANVPNAVDSTLEALQGWDSYKHEYALIRQKAKKTQAASRLYDRLATLGLRFGPAFRNITEIHTGDGFGHGELQVHDTAARMPEGVETPIPIHPTLLDAAFQMMICSGTVRDDSPAMAPSLIESLYISAEIPPVGSRMSGYSTLSPKIRLKQSGNVILSDDSWTQPKVILKGFVCRELDSAQLRHAPRKICTRLDWRMDVLSSATTARVIITHVGPDVKQFKPGDKVVGMLQGSFNSHVRIRSTIIQHVPDHMTLEDATTAIVSFLTAWIALVNKAHITRNETVLIHYGAGGVGQAAIQICQHLGVEIYTTVGSPSKKKLLVQQYGLAEDHIFYSRDSTFAGNLMKMTAGRGVDVVLNSTSGELLRQSWLCVADHGRFVEIGKRDILTNVGLDMHPFIRGPVHMECSEAMDEIFHLFRTKRFRALNPLTVYSYSQVEQAFRALQAGEISGKVVVQARQDDLVPVVPPVEGPLAMDPDSTYLLAGGLGGIGRSIADMLLSHGARHLAFISRSGDAKGEARRFMDQLQRHGCDARAYACDISDRESLRSTLARCSSEMPPIKGLIQCSMILKDGIFEQLPYEDWIISTRPKIQGSWNLHELLPPDLHFFIMLSSVSGIIGNAGQANYAAGNAFVDALAHFRRRQGLTATALDLGAVRDVGYIAESSGDRAADLAHTKAFQVAENEVLRLVKLAIAADHTVGQQQRGRDPGPGRNGHHDRHHEIPAQIIMGLGSTRLEMEEFLRRAHWARDAKFSTLWKPDCATNGSNDAALQSGLEAFSNADSLEAAAGIAEDMIVSRMARMLMIPMEDINGAQPLHTYGVNSLVAVEIRAWIAKEFQTEIAVFDILSSIPLSGLATKIVRESKLLPARLMKETSGSDEKGERAEESHL
ncbi:type I polyketide synthase [Aspergillus fijiensis CBS 313.89]|uniref:Ketoacyl-synt-domain-containing protein n=1 Tax=Aspergillus fijiensis CBS 313.89 TaxID=1448319 RepID=A0A8G1RQ98_9EURO|nr:ketoacyl-synt-domain-containing protein [Aspergillus fijiensis CBS 313.89]RAK74691.1 ketoacyl-synt-domain-containing protein [Aspergillus fijiensis CBS 313.89]